MRSRRYTEEVGIASLERPVPMPVAVVVIAIVIAVGALIVRQVVTYKSAHEVAAQEAAPATVAHR